MSNITFWIIGNCFVSILNLWQKVAELSTLSLPLTQIMIYSHAVCSACGHLANRAARAIISCCPSNGLNTITHEAHCRAAVQAVLTVHVTA